MEVECKFLKIYLKFFLKFIFRENFKTKTINQTSKRRKYCNKQTNEETSKQTNKQVAQSLSHAHLLLQYSGTPYIEIINSTSVKVCSLVYIWMATIKNQSPIDWKG